LYVCTNRRQEERDPAQEPQTSPSSSPRRRGPGVVRRMTVKPTSANSRLDLEHRMSAGIAAKRNADPAQEPQTSPSSPPRTRGPSVVRRTTIKPTSANSHLYVKLRMSARPAPKRNADPAQEPQTSPPSSPQRRAPSVVRRMKIKRTSANSRLYMKLRMSARTVAKRNADPAQEPQTSPPSSPRRRGPSVVRRMTIKPTSANNRLYVKLRISARTAP
jgi:hypothetical protein